MPHLLEFIRSFSNERSNLIPVLQKIQETEGYLSNEAIEKTAAHFKVSPVEVEGVLSFYAHFKRKKPGRFRIAVCDGTACHIKGASLIIQWLGDDLGLKPGDTDASGLFSLETVACLGCCSLAPVISINGRVYGNLDRKTLTRIVREYKGKGEIK